MAPWMSSIEIETILKYLSPESVMLEYGSGGSTNFFPKYVKQYYSIEHNFEWYNKVSAMTSYNDKIHMYHIRQDCEMPKHRASNWEELDNSSRSKEFAKYIKYPAIINKTFDAVLIDGRARPECAKFIYDYLNDGDSESFTASAGHVFMHDYWPRKRYHVVTEKYDIVDSVKTGQSLVVLQKKV